MGRLSPEEERELIAEMEALRDADEPIDPSLVWTFPPGTQHHAILRVELPAETIGRLYKVGEAHGMTMGEVIVEALAVFERQYDAEAGDHPVTAHEKKPARAS